MAKTKKKQDVFVVPVDTVKLLLLLLLTILLVASLYVLFTTDQSSTKSEVIEPTIKVEGTE